MSVRSCLVIFAFFVAVRIRTASVGTMSKDYKRTHKPKEPTWCVFKHQWLPFEDYTVEYRGKIPKNKRTKVRCPQCNKRLQLTKRKVCCDDLGCDHWMIPKHKAK